MDVSKAKVIIIALLVAFNIFLLSNNLSHVRGQNTSENISNTVTILKSRGISFECGIPRAAGSFRKLKYGNGKLDRASIVAKLIGDVYDPDKGDTFENDGKKVEFEGGMKFVFTDDRPSSGFDLGSDDKLKKALQALLKEKGLIDSNYIIDKYGRNRDGSVTVNFIEKYENYPIFNNYCNVLLTADGIIKLDYSKYQIIGFTGDKIARPQAYQALLAYYQEGAEITITGIDYGYNLDNSNIDGMETIEVEVMPVWRVKLKDGSGPDYLDANNPSDSVN